MAVDDSYTKSLLHFDGTNGSTTFTDEAGITWTPGGGAKQDNAHYKFGVCAGYFDGTDDYLSASDTADLQLGLTFTIDFWFYSAAKTTSNYRGIIDKWVSNTGYTVDFPTANSGAVRIVVADMTVTSSTDICNSAWHHVAMVGDGTTLKLYIDGTSEGTPATITGKNNTSSGHNIFIGGDGVSTLRSTNAFWIDELRFSKGIARWTANFTPPSAAYAPAATFKPKIIMF